MELDDLRGGLERGPTVLLLRHAQRAEITDPRTGNNMPLTAAGEAAALRLGRSIAGHLRGEDPVVLAHSPVLRCAQTVSALRAGLVPELTAARVIGARDHLGGPYLRDPPRALEAAWRLGSGFLRQWFDGAFPSSLLQPLAEAARDQVRWAVDALDQDDSPRLAILVSHDWNLMLVREHFFGVRHEDAGWIDFLDGVAVCRAPDGVTVSYRRRVVPVA